MVIGTKIILKSNRGMCTYTSYSDDVGEPAEEGVNLSQTLANYQ